LDVKAARSTWEAIDILKGDTVDVVVIDLEMSGEISTLGLFNWIEQNHPELAPRVIFTTSNVQDQAAADIIRRFSCFLLRKPFQIDEFWNALRKVLALEVTLPLKH
jgi:CheY-like chemotaxis protein